MTVSNHPTEGSPRRLLLALATSLVLHAGAVLGWWLSGESAPAAAARVIVVLGGLPQPRTASVDVADPARRTPDVTSQRAARAGHGPPPTLAVAAPAQAVSPPAPAVFDRGGALSSAPAGVPGDEPVAAPPRHAEESPLPRGANGLRSEPEAAGTLAAADADALTNYRQALARVALAYKRYPPLARERGWEGTVEVVVTLLPRHPEPAIRLGQGSGHALLDSQALDMMSRAVRRLPVPEQLQLARAELVFPIRYRITD